MTNEDKLYEVDTFVAMCEDFMHGKDGDDATKCRKLLAEVIKELSKLHQTAVVGQSEQLSVAWKTLEWVGFTKGEEFTDDDIQEMLNA